MRAHLLPSCLLLVACSETTPVLTDGGSYEIAWSTSDGTIPLNEMFRLDVSVVETAEGTPAENITLSLTASMPMHDHEMETEPAVSEAAPGSFAVDGMLFHMPGEWMLSFDVDNELSVENATVMLECCNS